MKCKRLFAAAMAFSMLLCGCQKVENKDSDSSETEEQTEENVTPLAEDYLTIYAKQEEMPLPVGSDYLYDITPVKDGYICVASGETLDLRILHYNEEFTDYTEKVLVQPAPYNGYYFNGGCILSLEEDEYRALVVMENHGGMEPYNPDMDPGTFDWEAYQASWESEYFLCTYAKDGTLAEKVGIEGLDEYRDDQGYDRFSDFFSDGEHNYLTLYNGAILSISADGKLTEIVPAEDEEAFVHARFFRDRDGEVVYFSGKEEMDDEGYYVTIDTLSDFDVNTGKPGKPFYTLSPDGVVTTNISSGGWEDYRIFVNEEDYSSGSMRQVLYGIRDDGEKEEVIDWTASNLESINVTPLRDGSFIGQDFRKAFRITRKYASELKDSKVLRIGVLDSDYGIRDFVMEFNRSQDDYKLETVVYKNSDGSYLGEPNGSDDALDNLKLAVVSNDAPDLLMLGGEHDSILRLGSRGVFCDLYEMMDGDPELSRDKLLPNVLRAMEHPSGALYSLPGGFGISTIVVKSKFTTKENWTMDDMIELYEDADDKLFYWTTKQDTLKMMLLGTDFTDELSGTCNFDSPEFIRMLEFCNRYPLESTRPEKNYDDPAAMERFDNWHYNSFHRYQNDEDYLYFGGITAFNTNAGLASAWSYIKAALGGADVTLVGYPSDNGKGGKLTASSEIAILGTCQDKAAAWDIVKAYVQSRDAATGYSIFNDLFEEQIDDEMYIWDFGERSDAEYYDDDDRVYPLTQEERDAMETYIRSCDTYMMLDKTVESIVYEEADKYFRGNSTAEAAANMIQNRAELYLAEQS